MRKSTDTRPRRAWFALRALGVFMLFLLIAGALYVGAYHHFRNVGEWGADDYAEVTYNEETFRLAGMIGKDGLFKKDYPADKIVGEIKPAGRIALTHAFTVTSVEDTQDFILITREDDKMYLYYRDGVENPAKPKDTAETTVTP